MQRSVIDAMLFLFDIDGTLLRGMPPAHRQAICEAALAVYGVRLSPEDLGQTAGMTDIAILRRALTAHRVEGDLENRLPDFFTGAAAAYERLVPADLRRYHTPHAQLTLDWLAARGARLGLVTGNIERIAWLKLRAAGLADYFALGAFGDEAEERAELPALALTRAQELYRASFAPEDVYVVGDTPADIACGVACGLRTVAVATGVIHSIDELRACGPDYAFADLGWLRTLPI
ncbi:MAG: HAD family hydrolase [Ktedonobacterales bacterium]